MVESSDTWICEPCDIDQGSYGEWEEGTDVFKKVKLVHGKHKGWKKGIIKPSPRALLENEATNQMLQISEAFFKNYNVLKEFSNISETEFQSKLLEFRHKFRHKIDQNFPNISFGLMVNLSVMAQLMIEDITQPFMLINMGNPSSYKSTTLSIVNSVPGCLKLDKFSPKSFVTHAANVKKQELAEIDLLPKIKNKTLITPELAPLFSGDEKLLIENLGLLTLLLDGSGLETASGVHGKRGYTGEYYFMWLGAVVDIPHKVWKVLGTLGFKIYFFRLPQEQYDETTQKEKIKQIMKEVPYRKKLIECKDITNLFWNIVQKSPIMNEGKVIWNKDKDDNNTFEKIIEISIFLSKIRGVVPTWHTEDSGGSNYHYEMPTIENPERAANALYNLARGHAVICGRNYITQEDLSVVISVAFSSAARERVALVKLLVENNGKVSTEQFEKTTKVSKATALKNMELLHILGLVEWGKEESETKPVNTIVLKEGFSWIISVEFRKHWNEFTHMSNFSKLSPKKENLEKNGTCVPRCKICGKKWIPNTSVKQAQYDHLIHAESVVLAFE